VRRRLTRLALAALALAGCRIERHAVLPADLVLRGGAVYTMDATRSWAQAVAVRGERLVYVGGDSGVTAFIGPSTVVKDLAGQMVLPGFEDAHIHPAESGMGLIECALDDSSTRAGVAAKIGSYARAHPELKWIRGAGWQLPVFPEASPRRELLDSLVPDRPAYFDAADGHSAWVNSKALALAGVTRDTRDPPNGRIERDPKTGEPSGTLRESAVSLVSRLLPKYTAEQRVAGLKGALVIANRAGLTSLYEAHASEAILATYVALDNQDSLTARVVAALNTEETEGPAQIPAMVALREKYRSPHFKVVAAKIFADGVIESGTAALLEPYLLRHGDRGHANLEPAAFDSLAIALDKAGFQIHIHAIGDRAIRWSLDALEAARKANGVHDARPIIAHLQLIDPADIPRFRQLGVIADFQPLWAYADDYITKLTEPQLGPARSRWDYPIGSVVRSGAVVVAGSDWSVSSLNPLEAIQVAMTRRGPTAGPGPAWIPEEVVDLPTMLAAYTINAAYAFGQERETGSLEVGKAADLVVLDHNLFDIAPDRIHTAKVVMTVIEGRVVYQAK
jgi:predicted amidohydrolase YtcJ